MTTDTKIHRLYHATGLSLMRIAKLYDCSVQDVRDALDRAGAHFDHGSRRMIRYSKTPAWPVEPVQLDLEAAIAARHSANAPDLANGGDLRSSGYQRARNITKALLAQISKKFGCNSKD